MVFEISNVLIFYYKPFSWYFRIIPRLARKCLFLSELYNYLFYHWSGDILQSPFLSNRLGSWKAQKNSTDFISQAFKNYSPFI
jgi:hypothetical protein